MIEQSNSLPSATQMRKATSCELPSGLARRIVVSAVIMPQLERCEPTGENLAVIDVMLSKSRKLGSVISSYLMPSAVAASLAVMFVSVPTSQNSTTGHARSSQELASVDLAPETFTDAEPVQLAALSNREGAGRALRERKRSQELTAQTERVLDVDGQQETPSIASQDVSQTAFLEKLPESIDNDQPAGLQSSDLAALETFHFESRDVEPDEVYGPVLTPEGKATSYGSNSGNVRGLGIASSGAESQ